MDKKKFLKIFGIFAIVFIILAVFILWYYKKISTTTIITLIIIGGICTGAYMIYPRLSKKSEKEEEMKEMEYYEEIARNKFRSKLYIEPIRIRGESAHVGTTSTPIAIIQCNDYWKDKDIYTILINKRNINDISVLPINISKTILEQKIQSISEKPVVVVEEYEKAGNVLTGITQEKKRIIPQEVKIAELKEAIQKEEKES